MRGFALQERFVGMFLLLTVGLKGFTAFVWQGVWICVFVL